MTCDAEIVRAITPCIPVVPVEMKGNEMNAAADIVLFEQLNELVSSDA